MKSIKVKDLPPLIMDRLGLVLFEDLYKILHANPKKSPEVFRTIVINALSEYAKTYPIIREISLRGVSQKCLTFTDNFNVWLQGSIPETSIILKARGVKWVKNYNFLSSDYWRFDPDT